MLSAPETEGIAVTLAIFDLDNTLIGDDSDNLWGQWVCEQGIVQADDFGARNDAFYADYKRGELDIDAYLRFALSPLAGIAVAEANRWHEQFMADKIDPIMLPQARALLDRHRGDGDTLLIITATNRFVTAPIAAALGVEHLIACDAQIIDGRYTGEPEGIPSFHEGKVTRLDAWLTQHDLSAEGAFFYSDSHNDLPLLERVDNPVAVDPDATLEAVARERGWPVISLR